MNQEKLIETLKALTEKEVEALEYAINGILDEESERLKSLWGVVTSIIGDIIGEDGVDIKDILKILDPETDE